MHSPAGVVLLAVIGVSLALPAGAAGNPQAGQQKAAACMGCHGPDGNSPALPPPAEPWPKLAGQVPEYMVKQLQDFKAGRRKNEQMSPQAQAMAEADVADIAAFFAQQKIHTGEAADKALLAQGEQIFLRGKARPKVVAACVGCHGMQGAGQRDWNKVMAKQPSVLAPAIGSQHASYLVKQLKAYKDGSRSNDVAKVMRDIAAQLDEREIEAVAAYVTTVAR